MSLPWVRLDTGLPHHDKILALLADPSPKRWQAAFSYVSALAWSGDHETDGRINQASLPIVHGTATTARLLVKYRLWEEETAAWRIVNYERRQQLAVVTAAKSEVRRAAGEKGNCVRHHEAGCWKNGKCSHAVKDTPVDRARTR